MRLWQFLVVAGILILGAAFAGGLIDPGLHVSPGATILAFQEFAPVALDASKAFTWAASGSVENVYLDLASSTVQQTANIEIELACLSFTKTVTLAISTTYGQHQVDYHAGDVATGTNCGLILRGPSTVLWDKFIFVGPLAPGSPPPPQPGPGEGPEFDCDGDGVPESVNPCPITDGAPLDGGADMDGLLIGVGLILAAVVLLVVFLRRG